MTPVSGEATSTGVEEAIYVGAGATGKKYLSQFRGSVPPSSSGSSHRSPAQLEESHFSPIINALTLSADDLGG